MPLGPILCVDDEPANLALLRETLKQDYRLVFARTGTESLSAVEKHHPSLILMDVQLPDLDGYAVCRRLKAAPHTADMPLIFVTGLTSAVDQQTGFDAGGVDYITKPIVPAIVRARVRTHLSLVRTSRLEQAYHDAIYMLGIAGHFNDVSTGAHLFRMAAFSRALAEAAGWGPDRCALIELAAPMHDTGKLGIPTAILTKPDKLSAAEWETMKTHARIGHRILSRSQAPVFQLAAEIALGHHEKWDGSGYPQRLSGTDIPESARRRFGRRVRCAVDEAPLQGQLAGRTHRRNPERRFCAPFRSTTGAALSGDPAWNAGDQPAVGHPKPRLRRR